MITSWQIGTRKGRRHDFRDETPKSEEWFSHWWHGRDSTENHFASHPSHRAPETLSKRRDIPHSSLSSAFIMSSTYVHYSAPSSLPSDYALLSRYAAAHDVENNTNDGNSNDEPVMDGPSNHPDDDMYNPNSVPIPGRRTPVRRSSFPTLYVTPFNPTTGPLPDKSGYRSGPHPSKPSENTPLLGPLVPRIEEEVDKNDRDEPAVSMLMEEIRILGKYTLPVFGFVSCTSEPSTALTIQCPQDSCT